MASHPRTANRIIATAIGLMVLVSAVVGVLGWRLVSQEERLVNQQARDRVEQTAEQMLDKFLRRLEEIESWLSQRSQLAAGNSPVASGATAVWLSEAGVEVEPRSRLLYYPTTPTTSRWKPFTPSVLVQLKRDFGPDAVATLAATQLERRRTDENHAIRAEAMLRLARAQAKRGQIADALSTYEGLSRLMNEEDPRTIYAWRNPAFTELLIRGDPGQNVYFLPDQDAARRTFETMLARGGTYVPRVQALTNPAGVPYRLLSQFERCQLLVSSGREDEAREEARRLASEMSRGLWRLDNAAFSFYDSSLRALAELGPPPPESMAISNLVESMWEEWQAFRRSGSAQLTKRVHRSGDSPLIGVVSANHERWVAIIADQKAIPSMGLNLDIAGENTQASLVDEQGRMVLGKTSKSFELEAVRSLSEAGLPWRLRLVVSNEEANTLLHARRNYAIMALSVFVLLVGAACYAIARGALREAAAGRLQRDFVSAVSHEFRSPLTALRQLTELLAQGRIQDESRRRVYFDVLLKETSRLHHLVEDLLDFGRMDAGRRNYNFEPIELSRLVDDAIQEYHSEADANRHRIEFTPYSGRLIVEADRGAMKRVVRNLLENAVKYSPDSLIVSVETGAEERSAVLRVRDEGMGIPLDEQSRIFEKFVRGEAAKSACIQGTGIGLSMVKEIVGVHHGHVSVRSEVGRGSTFVVHLPLSETDERRPA